MKWVHSLQNLIKNPLNVLEFVTLEYLQTRHLLHVFNLFTSCKESWPHAKKICIYDVNEWICAGKFYICSSCIEILGWRNPTRWDSMQIFITAKLLYMFRASIAPIIRSTSNCSCSLWYRPYYLGSKFLQTWPRSQVKKIASQIVWSVPEAATTVWCTPDDGGDGRPKHVQ